MTVQSFIIPYLHHFLKCYRKHIFWCSLGQIWILFGANLDSLLKKFMSKLHLFGTNLVSNGQHDQLHYYTEGVELNPTRDWTHLKKMREMFFVCIKLFFLYLIKYIRDYNRNKISIRRPRIQFEESVFNPVWVQYHGNSIIHIESNCCHMYRRMIWWEAVISSSVLFFSSNQYPETWIHQ